MNRFLKAFLLAGTAAALFTVSACSDLTEKESESIELSAASRSVVSSANGSINVTGMSGTKMTVSYNAGSQKSNVRLYVSEGNGKGLILANQAMNYSNGTYSYTVSHPTFTGNAKIYICVLVNDNGVEKCVPQGNLADCASWSSVTYGTDTSTGSTSTPSNSNNTVSNNEAAYDLGEGTFFFIAKCSNKALDVANVSKTHGENVHQWEYGDQANQHWILRKADSGYYTIISQNSGLCLDVDNWGKNAGANILQWDVGNNQSNQQFKFVLQSDNSFKVVNRNSGLVMDVSNSSKENGANVQQWTWNGSDAQKWFITKISDSMATGTSSNNSSSNTNTNTNNNNVNLMAGATNGTSVGTDGFSFEGSGSSFSRLVWSDEFEGNSLNMKNWKFETGNGGWGNQELQNYTNGSNVSVGNGVMTITAKSDLTSTRIKSAGLKQFKYGKIEARIKTDQGTGSWPAFWMLGTGHDYQWPYCGEIDIMEHANNDNFVFQTCHWNGSGMWSGYNHAYWGQTTNNNYWNVIKNLDVTQWHTYGIEWTPSQIRFYTDGVQVMACDIGNAANGTDAFNQPFYILFNFAMGGQFTNIYNAGAFQGMPWHMYVDYVRCYQ